MIGSSILADISLLLNKLNIIKTEFTSRIVMQITPHIHNINNHIALTEYNIFYDYYIGLY